MGIALLGTTGCRAGYLAQLAYEEMRFLRSATPATEMLARAGDPERRRALETLLSVREFAEREGLDVGGSYRAVADVSSAAPFHVVTAAYVDRLEPYTWWYPIVGAIPYRGYFDRSKADEFAAGLRAEGLDTMVVEASAYSTLGWLDDPLPSNVLERGPGAVVITVLHELVHQTFFAPNQVAFNETLATAVAFRLAERYYEQKGDTGRATKVRAAREGWVGRSDVFDATAVRLETFFGRARQEKWSRERLLTEREAVYAEVMAQIRRVDPDFVKDTEGGRLDNASFLASHRYAKMGRAIDAFLGRHPDMRAAFAALERAQARGEELYAFIASPPVAPPAPRSAARSVTIPGDLRDARRVDTPGERSRPVASSARGCDGESMSIPRGMLVARRSRAFGTTPAVPHIPRGMFPNLEKCHAPQTSRSPRALARKHAASRSFSQADSTGLFPACAAVRSRLILDRACLRSPGSSRRNGAPSTNHDERGPTKWPPRESKRS